MHCPYADCGREIAIQRNLGICAGCGEPSFLCSACGAANRAFARWCRSCRAKIEYPNPSFPESTAFSKQPRLCQLAEPFWTAPVLYKGYLWFLSTGGGVFRFSPSSWEPIPVRSLGEGFGRCPFVIREIIISEDSDGPEPFLIAISPKEVKGISLVTLQTRELLSVAKEESILASSRVGFVAAEADARTIYILKTRNGTLYLASVDVVNGQLAEFPITASFAAGPILVGGKICVYSETSLYVLNNKHFQAFPLPSGFHAWVLPEARPLRSQFGKSPFLVAGKTLYIPGLENNVPGLLFITLLGTSPEMAFIPIRQEATYTQDLLNRPVLSTEKKVLLYQDAGSMSVKADDQLISRRPAYFADPDVVAFTQRAGGEWLRFYIGTGPQDYSTTKLHDFVEVMGFFGTGTCATLAYVDTNLSLGLAVWDA